MIESSSWAPIYSREKKTTANVSSWKFFQWDCKTQVCKLRTVKLALCLTHSAFNKEFNRFQRIAYEYKNQTGTRFCFENQTWKPHSFSLTMISLRNPFFTKIMILCPPFSLRAFCHYYLLPVFLQQSQYQALSSMIKHILELKLVYSILWCRACISLNWRISRLPIQP